MSDSAAAAADWQAQLPIAYSEEGASREEAAAEHGAAREINFNARNGCRVD